MRVACVQTLTTDRKDDNVATILGFVDQAADAGARLVATPELAEYLGTAEGHRAAAEPLDGPTVSAFRRKAVERKVWILIGSVHEQVPGADRFRNTSVLISPDGEISATYTKSHLFDVRVPGHFDYQESAMVIPGSGPVTAEIDGVTAGFSICYDVRFPELYRAYADRGARMIFVPAAFQLYTGRDHWEVLLRARAIENLSYVIAPATIGGTPPTAGRSIIVDPWGVVIAQACDRPGIITADLDFDHLESIRERLPALSHRRDELFR